MPKPPSRLATFVLLVLGMGTAPARAIIILGSPDPAHPGLDSTFAPGSVEADLLSFQAKFVNGSGVAIAPRYFATAYHLSHAATGTFAYGDGGPASHDYRATFVSHDG